MFVHGYLCPANKESNFRDILMKFFTLTCSGNISTAADHHVMLFYVKTSENIEGRQKRRPNALQHHFI